MTYEDALKKEPKELLNWLVKNFSVAIPEQVNSAEDMVLASSKLLELSSKYSYLCNLASYAKIVCRDYKRNKDKQEYEVLLGLRLSYGIDKKKFLKTYGKKIEECYNYNGLIKNGFIMEDQDRVYIPEDKFYISNEIIVNFIEGVKDGEE